jgi:hypothetical protein
MDMTEPWFWEYAQVLTIWGKNMLPGQKKEVILAAFTKALRAIYYVHLLDENLLQAWWR